MSDNIRSAFVEWQGGMRFKGNAAAGGPAIVVDADAKEGPGPMVALLIAGAGCTGADVIGILEKMQVKLRKYTMTLKGLRAEEHPKRYLAIDVAITMAGDGLDETKARRAIDLSLEKYCSVMQSLNPDITVRYELVLES